MVVIGSVPPWIDLGPPEVRDGVTVRPVLGDWSHRGPWDQPPTHLVEPESAPSVVVVEGPTEPLPQRLPGRHISELKGKHSGRAVLLFNGPSLAKHNLFRIRDPLIGMNRTFVGNKGYTGPQPEYLCAIDEVWMRHPDVLAHPGLINGGNNETATGYRATRSYRGKPFSFDLAHDGYVPLTPGTTGFLALQVAVWMGFTELYCLGLDLSGGHFDGSSGVSQHFAWMNRYYKAIAKVLGERDIRVTICGSPDSKCSAFEHTSFEELAA